MSYNLWPKSEHCNNVVLIILMVGTLIIMFTCLWLFHKYNCVYKKLKLLQFINTPFVVFNLLVKEKKRKMKWLTYVAVNKLLLCRLGSRTTLTYTNNTDCSCHIKLQNLFNQSFVTGPAKINHVSTQKIANILLLYYHNLVTSQTKCLLLSRIKWALLSNLQK